MEKLKTFLCLVKYGPLDSEMERVDADVNDGGPVATGEAPPVSPVGAGALRVLGIEALWAEVARRSGMVPLSGGRPPPAMPAARAGERGMGFHILSGDRPPGIYGGSQLAGWWAIDDVYAGRGASGDKFALLPFTGARCEVDAWLGSDYVQAWLGNATDYCLLEMRIAGDF